MLVASHESEARLYRPPVFVKPPRGGVEPPHTIISAPVHTAEWFTRGEGALAALMVLQRSRSGSYRAMTLVPTRPAKRLPQIRTSAPLQTAVYAGGSSGASTEVMGRGGPPPGSRM